MDAGVNKIITVLDPATTIINPPKWIFIMNYLSNNQILQEVWGISTLASVEKYKFSDNFLSLVTWISPGVYKLTVQNIVSGTFSAG